MMNIPRGNYNIITIIPDYVMMNPPGKIIHDIYVMIISLRDEIIDDVRISDDELFRDDN